MKSPEIKENYNCIDDKSRYVKIKIIFHDFVL